MSRPLPIDWVIRRQVALGPAPTSEDHLLSLERSGIRAILSLCAESEAPPPATLAQRFRCSRIVLSDHRSAATTTAEDLLSAVTELERLRAEAGAVYVHCLAAVERSPLVCIAWLMRSRGLSRLQALDYVMAVHPFSSPIPVQLQWLSAIELPT